MLKLLGKILRQPKKVDGQQMIADLRSRGAVIGEDVYIYSPSTTTIDVTSAYLLSIGDHVRITSGVRILTHDYAWAVLKDYTPEQGIPGAILGAQGPVEIGNHVYIGMNAIILRGVRIGDHVIIGAGSVVTKDCEANSVYAGNPARKVCTLEAYYQKRQAQQFPEAKELALRYRARLGTMPPMEVFSEYFQLFMTRQQAEANPAFMAQMSRMGSLEQTRAYMDAVPPMFDGYEAFLAACYAGDETPVNQVIKREKDKRYNA